VPPKSPPAKVEMVNSTLPNQNISRDPKALKRRDLNPSSVVAIEFTAKKLSPVTSVLDTGHPYAMLQGCRREDLSYEGRRFW